METDYPDVKTVAPGSGLSQKYLAFDTEFKTNLSAEYQKADQNPWKDFYKQETAKRKDHVKAMVEYLEAAI